MENSMESVLSSRRAVTRDDVDSLDIEIQERHSGLATAYSKNVTEIHRLTHILCYALDGLAKDQAACLIKTSTSAIYGIYPVNETWKADTIAFAEATVADFVSTAASSRATARERSATGHHYIAATLRALSSCCEVAAGVINSRLSYLSLLSTASV